MESLSIDFLRLEALSQFHFIRPWLISLLPVILIVWLLLKRLSKSSQWQDHLPKAVIDALQISQSSSSTKTQWAWLIAWALISLAMAGPSWLKQSVPVVQNQNATVIILDLSQSMLAKDLTPDRLTLAKYKLIDVLRLGSDSLSADGQFALIAYSGDAYTVSPLTDDPKTIESLLPALHPNLMPSMGSNVESAVTLADSLLSDAGILSGNILLITDGVAPPAFNAIKKTLSAKHSLSILGIASNEAAPVPLNNGGFLRKTNGEIVLASLNARELQSLANSLEGRFAQISSNESDLNFLLNTEFNAGNESNNSGLEDSSNDNTFDAWTDMGHFLLILILPIFLIFFRKGLVYCLPLLSIAIFIAPSDSYAASTWEKLWKNSDQRGAELIKEKNYEEAAGTFKNKDWSAVAAYKNADYAKTIEQLNGLTDANSIYNRANALALNGDIELAIESYKQVLEIDSNNADAQHNLALLEELKKQSEQQQEQQSGDDSSQQDDSQKSESEQSESDQQESQQQNSEQSQQQQNDSESEPQQSDDESDSKEQSDEESQQSKAEESAEEKDSEQKKSAAEKNEEQNSDADEESEAMAQAALAESPEPLKDSSEQWLRSIEDDPSGLLRRKFEYQAWQRQQQGKRSRLEKDKSGQQRY